MKIQSKPQSRKLEELLDSIQPIPGYDCLRIKQLGQEQIRAELAELTPEQVRAYWHQRHTALLALQAKLRAAG